MTLTEFLLERIAEDEATALPLCPGRERFNGTWRRDSALLTGVEDAQTRKHIARHDPARVLAECEAKRRIVEHHTYREHFRSEPPTGPILRALATVYADHPDYVDAVATP